LLFSNLSAWKIKVTFSLSYKLDQLNLTQDVSMC